MSRNEIEDLLVWIGEGIIALAWFIFRPIVGEIWLLIRVPFEMIYSFYQILMALRQLQEQLQILQYILHIIHNLTTPPLFQGILQSISPFASLIWLLFGGYIFFKIVIPTVADAL